MADEEHLRIIREGTAAWNQWREKQHPRIRPDLRGLQLDNVNLRGANLSGASLAGAQLRGANLSNANLMWADLGAPIEGQTVGAPLIGAADLTGADLTGALLYEAHLTAVNLTRATLVQAKLGKAVLAGADLTGALLTDAELLDANLAGATLVGADLTHANLRRAALHVADLSGATLRRARLNESKLYKARLDSADLTDAILIEADLTGASLVGAILERAHLERADLIETDLRGANLTGAFIYGVSAWNLRLDGATQVGLVISRDDEPTIGVDNLEVAQFLYLLLNNERIRSVIDTITMKVVLILGRFTPERKAVLDAIREALRQRGYLPVLVDFAKPSNRNITETISLLAHLARFVVADVTDARSVPQELERIVPRLTSVPVVPLLEASSSVYGMFQDFLPYPWVLELLQYADLQELMSSLDEKVIARAEVKARELQQSVR